MFAILAPVVVGLFLPTTHLEILSQKDFVHVTCSSDECLEKKTYLDQGYTCGTTVVKIWCYKDVMGSVAPETMQALKEKVLTPWQGYQLEIYEPRKTPELTFNTGYFKQWQIDQKVWLSNETKNISLVTYDLVLSQNADGVRLNFYYPGENGNDNDTLDLDFHQDAGGLNLWREETVQQGPAEHYIKSTVRLSWEKQ